MERLQNEDYVGKKYGRLEVISFGLKPIKGKNFTHFYCRCECGTEKWIRASNIKSGKTQSCGCLHRDIVSKANYINGRANTRIYKIWDDMKRRCSSPKSKLYKHYGGRGIKVCPEWMSGFQPFYDWAMENGYSDELTIDRIDNDGGYEPSNCRWATMTIQNGNRRMRRNKASGTIGVTLRKDCNKWSARITVDKKIIILGVFNTLDEAVEARRKAEELYRK